MDMQTAQTTNNQPGKKPGFMRRLYNWVLSWAETPYGTPALAVLSFTESSFFPIPPDVLQIALSASKPRRSFFYATVSLIASVCGAVLGYYIGYAVWATVNPFFFAYIFSEQQFDLVKNWYDQYGFWAILIAAFTPIPYKLFTITAGVCSMSLWGLILASIVGRGLRFFLVATLLWFFGAKIRDWIEKYFEVVSLLFVVLLIGGFFVIKVLI
ncbi:MAG: YqaA family protein [Thermoguttaceae bacterium]